MFIYLEIIKSTCYLLHGLQKQSYHHYGGWKAISDCFSLGILLVPGLCVLIYCRSWLLSNILLLSAYFLLDAWFYVVLVVHLLSTYLLLSACFLVACCYRHLRLTTSFYSTMPSFKLYCLFRTTRCDVASDATHKEIQNH